MYRLTKQDPTGGGREGGGAPVAGRNAVFQMRGSATVGVGAGVGEHPLTSFVQRSRGGQTVKPG